MRSNRVRSLLGLQSEENETNQNLANGAETTRRVPDNRRLKWEPGSKPGNNIAEEMLMNTEESVMANFDFLSRENDIEDEDEVMADETDDGFSPSQIVKKADIGGLGVDTDTEDVLKEFNFLTQTEVRGVGGVQPSLTVLSQAEVGEKGGEWSGGEFQPPAVEQTNLELGELEQLTINNDNDLNYDQVNHWTAFPRNNIYNSPAPLDDVKGSFSQDVGGKVHAAVSL